MTTETLIICILSAVSATGIAWHCALTAKEITYITLADGRKQERKLPLLFRLLLPHTQSVSSIFKSRIFDKTKLKIQRKIVGAGYDGLVAGEEILALHLLCPCVMGIFWVLFMRVAIPATNVTFLIKAAPGIYMVGPLYLMTYPSSWLKWVLAKRHKSIQMSLPFVLDLLTLSVEAGMDFMSALQRNVERRVIDPLGEELIAVLRSIQLGKTRREALREMSDRVNLAELRSVVNALVQADELGVSIGSILRIQSDQIRGRRFERAEKTANEAPVKMLFPLVCFIFPAVFVILVGPMFYQMMQQGW